MSEMEIQNKLLDILGKTPKMIKLIIIYILKILVRKKKYMCIIKLKIFNNNIICIDKNIWSFKA